ncbi:hypothetical protein [Brevundimonas sp.]|uniref:hypothetical protein n=1 Tax=Brevundimonas sp. TaxID=1871086 RepID=UPI00289B29A9|nr:hypothetical protein [Brevundimonas sp.]
MAQLTLPALPRQTTYNEVPIAAGVTQRPAWGGPLLPLARTGDRWAFEVSVPQIYADGCGNRIKAILAKGRLNTVIMAIPEPGLPVRNYGAPKTAMSGQQGTSMDLNGLTPNVIIPDGKWINLVINGQHYLYLVDGEFQTDASGNVSLKIWPMIRRSAPLNAVVKIADPVIEGFAETSGGFQVRRFGSRNLISHNFRIEERE